jgi:hypothetical protein
VVAVLLTVLLGRRLTERPIPRDPAVGSATTAAVVLLGAWVLSAPYALPWYDAMVWAFLPLVAPSRLDGALLARLGVLALGYVPGRVVGLGPQVERVTLGFRRDVAPWLVLAAIIVVVLWALSGRPRSPRPAGRRHPAPAPGR